MDERLGRMQETIDSLVESMAAMESRVAQLELSHHTAGEEAPGDRSEEAMPGASGSLVADGGASLVQILSVVGMTLLVLAGAFLLRAFTDTGSLSHSTGVALGLVYAVAWIVVGDRASARRATFSATCIGIAAVLIAYPLIWEATTKMGVLAPPLSATLLTAFTTLALAAAWRWRIYALAWVVTVGALVTSGALLMKTTQMDVFTVPILALGLLTVWLSYSRGWSGLRWPVALVADVLVAIMVYLFTRSSDYEGKFDHLSVGFVQLLALSLVLGYVGSFVFNSLIQHREASIFELLQTGAVLLLGLGGASRIAASVGAETTLLGSAALVVAAASYAVTFTVVVRRHGRGTTFHYFAWLALALMLLGSRLVLDASALPVLWVSLGAASAFLGGRYDRLTLREHCAALVFFAALQTGLLGQAIESFTVSSPSRWSVSLMVVLALMALCYGLLVATQSKRSARWRLRLPRFIVLTLTVVGLGGLTVSLAAPILPEGAAAIAVLRTAVISLAAVGLAAIGRKRALVELSWLVYPILVVGGLKLLAEDLRHGDPVAITVAFTCYGLALITAPRLQRRAGATPEAVVTPGE